MQQQQQLLYETGIGLANLQLLLLSQGHVLPLCWSHLSLQQKPAVLLHETELHRRVMHNPAYSVPWDTVGQLQAPHLLKTHQIKPAGTAFLIWQ